MIFKGNKEIIEIYKGKKIIAAIYKGAKLVWQSVRSCFGSGAWDNDKPWDNDDGWNNG